MAEGHPQARKYPLAMLWTEAELARERINAQLATEATLMHQVGIAVTAPKGKGFAPFKKLVEKLYGR